MTPLFFGGKNEQKGSDSYHCGIAESLQQTDEMVVSESGLGARRGRFHLDSGSIAKRASEFSLSQTSKNHQLN